MSRANSNTAEVYRKCFADSHHAQDVLDEQIGRRRSARLSSAYITARSAVSNDIREMVREARDAGVLLCIA